MLRSIPGIDKSKQDPLQKLPRWLFVLLAISLVVFAAVFSFGGSLDNELTNWDDPAHLTENNSIRGLDGEHLRAMFTETQVGVYMPITMLSYAVDYALSGGLKNLTVLHIHNLLLHICNALLLLLILQRTFGKRIFSLVCALLFVSLPVHTEAVVWLSSRKEVLSLNFALLALLAFQFFLEQENRWDKTLAFTAAFLFSACAMLSKNNMVILPGLLLLFHLAFVGRGGENLTGNIRKVMMKLHVHLPFFLLGLMMTYVHLAIARQSGTISTEYIASSFNERIMATAIIHLHYVQSFLIPGHLSPDYLVDLHGFSPALQVAAVFTWCAILITLAISFGLNRLLFFCIMWFVISMLPYANIFPTSILKADRYTYTASIAYCIMAAYVILFFWHCLQARFARVALVAATGLLLTMNGLAARNHTETWQNSGALWKQVLHDQPRNSKARIQLAKYYMQPDQKKWYLARSQLELGLQLGTNEYFHPIIANDLAFVYMHEGDYSQAIDLLDRHLSEHLTPPESDNGRAINARLYNMRGQALEAVHLLQQAVEDYRMAHTIAAEIKDIAHQKPLLKTYLYNFGTLAGRMLLFNEAETALHQSLSLDPDNTLNPKNADILFNLATILNRMGKTEEAIRRIQDAIKKQEATKEHLLLLGKILLAHGREDEAMDVFKQISIRIKGDWQARLHIAEWMLAEGLTDNAESLIRAGFEDPEFSIIGRRFLYQHYVSRAQAIQDNPESASQIWQDMIPALEKAIALNTADMTADRMYIQIHQQARKYTKAEKAWQRILPQLDTTSKEYLAYADLYREWGYALFIQRKQQEAIDTLSRYITLAPENVDTAEQKRLVKNLRSGLQAENLEQILIKVEQLLQEALTQSVEEQASLFQTAQLEIEKGIILVEQHPALFYFQGVIYYRQGKYADALQQFELSVQYSKDLFTQPAPLFWAGKAAFHDSDFATAVDHLNMYLNYTQWQGEHVKPAGILLYEIGKSYSQNKDHRAAADAFDKALGLTDIGTQWLHLHFLLGSEYQAYRQVSKARSQFIRYQQKTEYQGKLSKEINLLLEKLEQEFARCQDLLGRASAEISRKQFQQAETAIRDAITIAPDLPACYEALGDLHVAQGEKENATVHYEKAISLAPFQTETLTSYYKLAVILEEEGNGDAARRKLKVLVSHPDCDDALKQKANALLKKIE